ncbi:MAG: Fic family protein [Methylobacteriaceae bacterium]|nr:Fic family protein [Methylobacteriaceae bacterium]
MLETAARFEPARLEQPTAAIADVIAELAAAAALLARALHPRTAAALADLVRVMNTYYSNLIEGHDTRPKDIERALAGELDADEGRRNLQIEARAHVRAQAGIDRLAAANALPEPASADFLRALHRDFYADAPPAMLTIRSGDRSLTMTPGAWRNRAEEDNLVGRHVPPSSARVADLMAVFEARFRFAGLGRAARLLAMAGAHHRFAYIHPFPDGNGRVGRLMSHAMAAAAGIGAHGLWSVSRGLARGLTSRGDYKRMMDHADTPRQGDRDGRGNLSEAALADFTLWFLRVCLDQVAFMTSLFDLDALAGRMRRHVERDPRLKPEAFRLLEEALLRGEVERGDAARITGLPERSARRILAETVAVGLLGSDTPKGRVSLRFPADALEDLFPRLYPQA